MAVTNAIVPVALGGRFQNSAGLRLTAIVPSDGVPLGPVSSIFVTAAGNLALGGWDGSTEIVPVVAGQTLAFSAKFIKATGTTVPAGNIFALY